jgi:deoxyribodipyrimidine photo-lyase
MTKSSLGTIMMHQENVKNINSYRKFVRNHKQWNTEGSYVMYWMQANRRIEYNYALEYAVAVANHLQKPLLIYEGLNVNYPWACDRFHHFILEGMKEHRDFFAKNPVQGCVYIPYVERNPKEGKGLVYTLAEQACALITDEFPVYIIREHNQRVAQKISIPFITIDSNGVIPMGLTDKDPYSAYLFRKIMQKYVVEALNHPPQPNPLESLKVTTPILFPPEHISNNSLFADDIFEDLPGFISQLPIDHSIKKVSMMGTRKAALERMNHFLEFGLPRYEEDRNHPDKQGGSGLSPWLHFGKISAFEIVLKVLEKQPSDWNLMDLKPNGGKNTGFFRGHSYIESFLDELITWREVGFHYAHHRPDYDRFESLPDWALTTMREHDADPREHVYSLEELAHAKTHDPIWNAAQNQLRTTGVMHNYLRMLWGKKIIEWTANHQQALEVLIELNNRYALDGRDPNSYSGIFWCLGRFDRAWQERSIFGKLRYMSSESTSKKVKLKEYLKTYGSIRTTS